MGVPSMAAAPDLAGCHVQGGKERYGAMAEVVMGMPLSPPEAHRQDRLGALQGLDLALLVHAEDHRVLRRALIKPDHVADLSHKKRIGGEGDGLLPVRLNPEGLPDATDRLMRNAGFFRHGAGVHAARMRRISRWLSARVAFRPARAKRLG